MRTEAEIRAMLEALERINRMAETIIANTFNDDMRNETMAEFNRNGLMISVLQWVLGGDQLKVTQQ